MEWGVALSWELRGQYGNTWLGWVYMWQPSSKRHTDPITAKMTL